VAAFPLIVGIAFVVLWARPLPRLGVLIPAGILLLSVSRLCLQPGQRPVFQNILQWCRCC